MEDLCSKYSRYRLRLVVLFGSRARGDWLEDSDYDILVVADDLPSDPREAYEALYDPENPLVIPIGIRSDSFLRRLGRGDTFILEILEDGKILCADPEFLERVRRLQREALRRLRRVGRTWIMKE